MKVVIKLESEDQYSMAHVLFEMAADLVTNKFDDIQGENTDFACPVSFDTELIRRNK